MTYLHLAYVRLATVTLAFTIGTMVLCQKKGTRQHRRLGKCYMLLMLTTAVIALCIPAQIGPRFLGHFGWIQLFFLLVLYSAPAAFLAIRQGKLNRHKAYMTRVYVGGILIAGASAFFTRKIVTSMVVHIPFTPSCKPRTLTKQR